jgi:pyridoxal phosphate enzyme (YggS family)
MSREDELATNLADVRARVAAACQQAGRRPEEVTVIAVTKTWPAEDVRRLAHLGVSDMGENRDQEAAAKAAALADLRVTWHFVGQVQTNKAASVASYADVVHAVDRLRLVDALSRGAGQAGRDLAVLIQVSLDDDPGGRGGARPEDLPALADAVAAAAGLTLRGVMAVAPLGGDPAAAFGRLADVHERLIRDHPAATWRSAGMSEDFEAAIKAGATHLRVGTALLGRRPALG